jgi:hypothetical protein
MRALRIILPNAFFMLFRPGRFPRDGDIPDGSSGGNVVSRMNRHRQPLVPLGRFDDITIPPSMFVVLYTIIENENVRFFD